MNIEITRRRADLWTHYWSSGAAHSLGQDPNGYAGDIGRFWLAAFATLPPHARLLDIATGNGPLPRLMLTTPGRDDLRCDGVDLAQIAPSWLADAPPAARARVQFHPGTDAARLPFDDGVFDMVISQWGLEYTDLTRSLPELRRVLKPDGAVRLVVHHVDARPVQLAAEELRHSAWLHEPNGLLDTAGRMVPLLALVATEAGRAQLRGDPDANAQRARYNALVDALDEHASSSPCPDVLNETADRVAQALDLARQDAAGASLALSVLHRDLQDSSVRLTELVNHALDAAGIRHLAAALGGGEAGTQCEIGELRVKDALFGWTLSLRTP